MKSNYVSVTELYNVMKLCQHNVWIYVNVT